MGPINCWKMIDFYFGKTEILGKSQNFDKKINCLIK